MKVKCILLVLLLILSACTKWTSYPDFYLDKSIKKVKQKFVTMDFSIGSYDESQLYGNSRLFYEMDINKLNKDDLIKYFIIAYNKYYKTNYNAMVNISVKNNSLLFGGNMIHRQIDGFLLEIEE